MTNGTFDDNDRKFFDILQAIIARMNTNSFAIKGWTITVVSALLALGANTKDWVYLLITVIPIVVFWMLDARYLMQERQFRAIYEAAIRVNSIVKRYNLSLDQDCVVNPKKDDGTDKAKITYRGTFFSPSMNSFYPLLAGIALVCAVFIACKPAAVKEAALVKIVDTAKVEPIGGICTYSRQPDTAGKVHTEVVIAPGTTKETAK